MLNGLLGRKREIVHFIGIVLLIHLYRFVNYLPNWDCMYGVSLAAPGMTHFGRWLSGLANLLLHSRYDLQWVEGCFSTLWIALTIALILELFELRDKWSVYIAAFLFAAFPGVTGALCYSLWAPAYMLALFLAVAGAFLCLTEENRPRALCAAALCFLCGLAIYQAYITVALVLFLFYWGNRLCSAADTLSGMKETAACFAAALLVGGALYWLGEKIALRFWHSSLIAYQGISEAGLMSPGEYLRALWLMVFSFLSFFHGERSLDAIGRIGVYTVLNILLALVILGLGYRTILANRALPAKRKAAALLCFFALWPCTYCFYLASPGVTYHALMEQADFFVYFFILLSLRRGGYGPRSLVRAVSLALLASLCFYHYINDNVAYQQLSMAWQRTQFECQEVLAEIDRAFPETRTLHTPIAVIGRFPAMKSRVDTRPLITGASTDNFLFGQYHFVQFTNYYYGRDFAPCDEQGLAALERDERFAAMPAYPAQGYVGEIDGRIVVKLLQ